MSDKKHPFHNIEEDDISGVVVDALLTGGDPAGDDERDVCRLGMLFAKCPACGCYGCDPSCTRQSTEQFEMMHGAKA